METQNAYYCDNKRFALHCCNSFAIYFWILLFVISVCMLWLFSSFYYYILRLLLTSDYCILFPGGWQAQTLNKIFILPAVIAMRKFHLVRHGRFEIYSQKLDGDVPARDVYFSWGYAYSRFRYLSSFLGFYFVRLCYRDSFGRSWDILTCGNTPYGFHTSWYGGRAVWCDDVR